MVSIGKNNRTSGVGTSTPLKVSSTSIDDNKTCIAEERRRRTSFFRRWLSTLTYGKRGDEPQRIGGYFGIFLWVSTLLPGRVTLSSHLRVASNWFYKLVSPSSLRRRTSRYPRAHEGLKLAIYPDKDEEGLGWIDRFAADTLLLLSCLKLWKSTPSHYDVLSHDCILEEVLDILEAEHMASLVMNKEQLQLHYPPHPATVGYVSGGLDIENGDISYHSGWTMVGAWIITTYSWWNYIQSEKSGDRIVSLKPAKFSNQVFNKVMKYGFVPSRNVVEGDVIIPVLPTVLQQFTGKTTPLMNFGDNDPSRLSTITDDDIVFSGANFTTIDDAIELARTMCQQYVVANCSDDLLRSLQIGDIESARRIVSKQAYDLPILGGTIACDAQKHRTKFGGVTDNRKAPRVMFIQTQGDIIVQATSELGTKYRVPRLCRDASLLMPMTKHSWPRAHWNVIQMRAPSFNERRRKRLCPSSSCHLISRKESNSDTAFMTQMSDFYAQNDNYRLCTLKHNYWTANVSTIRLVPAHIEAIALKFIDIITGKLRHPDIVKGEFYDYYDHRVREYSDSIIGPDGKVHFGIPIYSSVNAKTLVENAKNGWASADQAHPLTLVNRVICKPFVSEGAASQMNGNLPTLVPGKRRKNKTPVITAYRRKSGKSNVIQDEIRGDESGFGFNIMHEVPDKDV